MASGGIPPDFHVTIKANVEAVTRQLMQATSGWDSLKACLVEDEDTEVLMLAPREDFDPAFLGVCHRAGDRCALYSKRKVMEILEVQLPTPEQELEETGESRAEAQYNFNTSGSAGWGFPMFLLDEEDEDPGDHFARHGES